MLFPGNAAAPSGRASRTHVLAIAVALIAATASSMATPAAAKMPGYGGQYIYDRVDSRCTSEQGDERRVPCHTL